MTADPSTRSHVLLVIEDEAPNRALLRAVLSRAAEANVREATLLEAGNLASARAILASHAVELILLDIRLPDGDGLELVRELTDQPEAERPRVLVLSASVLPTERDAAMGAGVDGFLAKPYRPAELSATLGAMLADG